MLIVKKKKNTTQVFNLCCSSKTTTEDILCDSFVHQVGKICYCQPTAASSESLSCYDVLIKTCLNNWWETRVCLLQRKSPFKWGGGACGGSNLEAKAQNFA